jgi:hypothetical protein
MNLPLQQIDDLLDLESRRINAEQAADLRARLAAFANEWDSPEMADYDDYEANRRKLASSRSDMMPVAGPFKAQNRNRQHRGVASRRTTCCGHSALVNSNAA